MSEVVCISDRIGSKGAVTDIKFTFHIVTPGGSELEVGVKTEEDLMQWVEAIRTCASKSLVCTLVFTVLPDKFRNYKMAEILQISY